MSTLTDAQLDGRACARCRREFTLGMPSVPDGHGPHGQLFRCETCPYARRVAAHVRKVIDHAEEPLMLLADVLDLTVPEVRARYDGDVPWNGSELICVASLVGVRTSTWLEGLAEFACAPESGCQGARITGEVAVSLRDDPAEPISVQGGGEEFYVTISEAEELADALIAALAVLEARQKVAE